MEISEFLLFGILAFQDDLFGWPTFGSSENLVFGILLVRILAVRDFDIFGILAFRDLDVLGFCKFIIF